ncbi:DUF1642 domain-containing protein [Lacticaseibacillus paracasei]|uniref:DUF1642 domain-containing protein n=1 Tax=Lacticaseibacillus paracasei TaxID=1597 RepID=UPI001F504B0C|nr:DUF1642 domain-containing protein [Lacticaseibacillus paracasei]MCI0374681.1 DUF1642 domain-containing protein [Lacticaseibacillus paracasei]
MNEEKLYAVKNDEGQWADPCYTFGSGAWVTPDKAEREEDAKHHGGHVVTLIEEPKKVVVSAEEAEMLKRAKDTTIWPPASVIASYAYEAEKDSSDAEALLEDRLMRAYVNGLMVEKPKRYSVKVPHTDDSYFYKVDDEYCNAGDSYYLKGMTDKKWFTEAEIEHYGLQDCKKEEVTDDAD